MLTRIQQWLDQLQLDPDKTSLRTLLPAINVVLVLLVITGISISAVGLLRKLSNEQGLARVQLASANAREELRRLNEDVFKQARNLAGDATLRRVLQDGSNDPSLLLRRGCQSAGFDACALVRGEQVLAQANEQSDDKSNASVTLDATTWQMIVTAAREQGERFYAVPSAILAPVMGASVVVVPDPAEPGDAVRLLALRFLDDALGAKLKERVDVQVKFINYRAFSAAPADAFTRLHSAALSDGRYAAARINDADVFAASAPVFASTGEAIAMIETELPTEDSDATTHDLTQRLLITAVVVGALAIAISLLLGQLVAKPVRALTDAAMRLAQGDFSTSIPTGGPAEVGVLSHTMEDMRRNLVALTSTLRRREAEAQAVLGGTSEGVYAVDKLRKITYLNPQATRLLNVNANEVIGQFCGDVLKPCVDKLGNRPCDAHCPILLARTAGHSQTHERLQLQEGVRSVIITSADLVDGLQVQVLRDETEVEAIRRARDSVLANISHEFRTPLAAQLASIELLLDGLENMPQTQVRELVQSLERSTQRLTALIDNLLESVRIESGQLSIRQQSVALNDVITEAQALVGSLLTQRNQTLEISLPDDLPLVTGDEVRLTQVFVNLLANANKYAPEQSVIRIGAELQNTWLNTWVEDEGPGVPATQLGSIFDRFARGPEKEPEPGGLGLGLWIVKSIVDRHGGHITATRTETGRTRFSFTLPIEAQRDESQE
jgi:signal transduction histidine kinase